MAVRATASPFCKWILRKAPSPVPSSLLIGSVRTSIACCPSRSKRSAEMGDAPPVNNITSRDHCFIIRAKLAPLSPAP
jgi:hypothetical protein